MRGWMHGDQLMMWMKAHLSALFLRNLDSELDIQPCIAQLIHHPHFVPTNDRKWIWMFVLEITKHWSRFFIRRMIFYSFRNILMHTLMSYHTSVLVTKNNMINQPVWTTSIIIMTKPQASHDSNIGWPETKMRNTTRNIKIWGIPMRPNHMEPNVCGCCASCSCLVWRKYKNLKKAIHH